MDDESWFCVSVEPRAESAVSACASRLAIVTYFPTGQQIVRRRCRTIVFAARRPVIPGYVFVRGEGHFSQFRRDFDAPDAVPHCRGWLNGADGPERVPPAVVLEMRQREADGEFDVAEPDGRYWAPRWLKPRARVKIITGALKGRTGEVWRLTARRKVSLWLTMMGRVTLTECPLDWVARAR